MKATIPVIAHALDVIGSLSIVAGCLLGIMWSATEPAQALESAIAGTISGVFCLGLAEIIKKLNQIEYNGRPSQVLSTPAFVEPLCPCGQMTAAVAAAKGHVCYP